MIQTIPTDCRDLKAQDRIVLVGKFHVVHRVRQTMVLWSSFGAPPIPCTELLHELLDEPGMIQTTIPHGAKIRVVLPL